jgi:Fe-Mn family superoxide dismutase
MNILLTTLISLVMTYEMPKLPYANNGLEPVISQATIDYHYGKHLQTYVNNLNSLAPSTEFEGKTVEEIVASAPDGAIFNNAGQVLNHTLYFLQFTPKPNKHEPSGKLAEAINRDFGSFENFKKEFNAAAVGLFGLGLAFYRQARKTTYHQRAKWKQPVACRPETIAGFRCMGTCLLFGLPEPPCRSCEQVMGNH